MSWKTEKEDRKGGKSLQGAFMRRGAQGATGGQSCWGPSERLCRTHLRTVHPNGEKAALLTHQLQPGAGLESLLRH